MNTCCVRAVLVSINIIFLLCGAALIIVGVIAAFFPVNPLIANYEEDIKEILKDHLQSIGENSTKVDDFHITEVFQSISIGMIVTGAILFVFCFFAIIGSIYSVQCYIFLYGIFVAVIVLAELIMVIVLYADVTEVIDQIKIPLRETIKTEYTGSAGLDIITLGWNFAMSEFQCCGVDNYKDFIGAEKWVTNRTVMQTTYTFKMPVYCCDPFPKDGDLSCATSVSGNSNKGCFEAVWDIFVGNEKIVAPILSVSFGLQLALVILSFMLFCEGRRRLQGKQTKKIKGGFDGVGGAMKTAANATETAANVVEMADCCCTIFSVF